MTANTFGADGIVKYSFEAETTIDKYTVKVGLKAAHEILAEYTKHVRIEIGGTVLVERILRDPGGFTTVYVSHRNGKLTIVDGLKRGFVFDCETRVITEIPAQADLSEMVATSSGRFAFVRSPRKVYQYISADEDSKKTGKSP